MKPLFIYIAGEYAPKTENVHDASRVAHNNVKKAIRAGIEIIKAGHYPYIPHLTHYLFLEMEEHEAKERQDSFWYEYDLAWIDKCDALFYLSKSKGADAELEYAKKKGKLIFHSIDEIKNLNLK